MTLNRRAATVLIAILSGCSSAAPRPEPTPQPRAASPAEPPRTTAPAADLGPQPMERGKFRAFVQRIDETAGDAGKLALLKTALAYNWITSAMAGVLLDHLTYRQSKLDAMPILGDRILDKENAYNILDHFTYREDKEKVQQLLLQ